MWRCAIGGIVPRKHKRPRRTFRAAVIRGGGSRIGGYLYYSMAAAMDDDPSWTPAAFDRALCNLADAELDALVAFIDAQQRILDDALADDRAMLDALQAADLAFLRSLR